MEVTKYLEPFLPALDKERAPDKDFVHKFLGFGTHKSECRVQIWEEVGYVIVMFADLGKGTSVTNAAETLCEEIWTQHCFRYPKHMVLFCETYDSKTLDVIIPVWEKEKVRHVTWKRLGIII